MSWITQSYYNLAINRSDCPHVTALTDEQRQQKLQKKPEQKQHVMGLWVQVCFPLFVSFSLFPHVCFLFPPLLFLWWVAVLSAVGVATPGFFRFSRNSCLLLRRITWLLIYPGLTSIQRQIVEIPSWYSRPTWLFVWLSHNTFITQQVLSEFFGHGPLKGQKLKFHGAIIYHVRSPWLA